MQFTDEQRLIVIMLAEVQKALSVKGRFNPDFVKAVASDHHEFAIAFEHQEVFTAGSEPADFSFVRDVLEMWSDLEESVQSLDEYGRSIVDAQLGATSSRAKFDGFDGNQEFTLIEYARLLIKDMRKFEEFDGRALNSHSPRRGRYSAMLREFAEIQDEIAGEREMNPGEIGRIMSAR